MKEIAVVENGIYGSADAPTQDPLLVPFSVIVFLQHRNCWFP